jgi:hypothetical protein
MYKTFNTLRNAGCNWTAPQQRSAFKVKSKLAGRISVTRPTSGWRSWQRRRERALNNDNHPP